jgi:hypothetical protein
MPCFSLCCRHHNYRARRLYNGNRVYLSLGQGRGGPGQNGCGVGGVGERSTLTRYPNGYDVDDISSIDRRTTNTFVWQPVLNHESETPLLCVFLCLLLLFFSWREFNSVWLSNWFLVYSWREFNSIVTFRLGNVRVRPFCWRPAKAEDCETVFVPALLKSKRVKKYFM